MRVFAEAMLCLCLVLSGGCVAGRGRLAEPTRVWPDGGVAAKCSLKSARRWVSHATVVYWSWQATREDVAHLYEEGFERLCRTGHPGWDLELCGGNVMLVR